MRAIVSALTHFLCLSSLLYLVALTMVAKFQSAHTEIQATDPSQRLEQSSPKRRRWFSPVSVSLPSSKSEKAIEERYFSSDYYEYEIAPRDSSKIISTSTQQQEQPTAALATTDLVITERMIPVTKRVYLIRHAESEENRRLASLTKSIKGLGSLKLPTKDDVMASMELLNVRAQLDSDVSQVGRKQISQLGNRLTEDDFVKQMGIQLVAHSPLKRARQTSEGMLGCVTERTDMTVEKDSSAHGKKASSVTRVVEMPFLSERTPLEWLPVNHDAFTRRIAEFEQWLGEQPEDVIGIVGHSQYFKSMLGLPAKFGNCDVWEIKFDFTVELSPQSVKEDVNTVESAQTREKIKKRFSFSPSALAALEETKNGQDVVDGTSDQGSTHSGMDDDKKGVLEKQELPRGWRELKHLYSFDPTMD